MLAPRFATGLAPLAVASALAACPTAGTLPEPPPMYPAPASISWNGTDTTVHSACVDTRALSSHATLDALVAEVVSAAGLTLGSGSACDWRLAFASGGPALSGEGLAAWTGAAANPERYAVMTRTEATGATTALYASSERAALYALRAALDFAISVSAGTRIGPSVVVDAPGFPWRGLVEGIYGENHPDFGTQYDPADRALLIRLLSRLRENTYIYGPKDDPYARLHWQTPYPSTGAGNAQAISLAAHEADANLVRFVWSLSPGADYWTDPVGGLAAAKAKLDSMRALGVHHFALFLDDNLDCGKTVPPTCNAAAIAEQASLANSLNDYVKAVDPTDHLLFVWWDYSGRGDASSTAIGKLLEPDIETLWTGPCVRSCTIAVSDIAPVNASLGREVSLWDNWPVDQTDISSAHHCCGEVPVRMTGRAPDLPNVLGAFYTNPVLNQEKRSDAGAGGFPLAVFIGQLGPIADYAWGPSRYTIDASYSAWSGRQADFIAKASNCGRSCATPEWSCTSANTIAWCDSANGCAGTSTCPTSCTAGSPAQCN